MSLLNIPVPLNGLVYWKPSLQFTCVRDNKTTINSLHLTTVNLLHPVKLINVFLVLKT